MIFEISGLQAGSIRQTNTKPHETDEMRPLAIETFKIKCNRILSTFVYVIYVGLCIYLFTQLSRRLCVCAFVCATAAFTVLQRRAGNLSCRRAATKRCVDARLGRLG